MLNQCSELANFGIEKTNLHEYHSDVIEGGIAPRKLSFNMSINVSLFIRIDGSSFLPPDKCQRKMIDIFVFGFNTLQYRVITESIEME